MIKTYLKAGYPVLAIRTAEPLRFSVAAAGEANGRKVFQWDCARGYQAIGATRWNEAEPIEIPNIAAQEGNSLWLLKNIHFWLREPALIQTILNNIPTYKSKGITLALIAPDFDLPPELAREIVILDFPLPDRKALGEILDALTGGQGINLELGDREKVLDSIQGLTWTEAEDALAFGLVQDKALVPQTLSAIKAQMVEKSASLQFSRFKETFANLGGLENLKAWSLGRFKGRRPGLPFRGVLILGVPGTGKSHFSKALGNEVSWPVLSLDMGRVFGSLVGQSEQKMRECLKVVDAMAPCILFIDEIEKALAGAGSGTSTDGGTTQRVGANFLTWLQDHTSEVFVIATCNDIKALSAASDGAFVRSGRWDATFFVDNPSLPERKAILEIYLKEFMGKSLADFPQLPDLAGYSGAEIRQVAIECAYNGGDLDLATKFVIPLSRSNKERIDNLRAWAADRTIPASIPPEGPEVSIFDFARKVTI
jgi:hypothetical protein